VQGDANAAIVVIENARRRAPCRVTLTRSAGHEETRESAVRADKCRRLGTGFPFAWSTIRARRATISLDQCQDSRIHQCTVSNYQRVGVDDRTESDLYGYAFRVIDGTGVCVTRGTNIQVAATSFSRIGSSRRGDEGKVFI